MYPSKFGLIIGFHGCDKEIRDGIVSGSLGLHSSYNDYDWLGSGMYFWENNRQRARQYAVELRDNPISGKEPIKTPAVLGAIIDFGYCLDLLDDEYIRMVKDGYSILESSIKRNGLKLPQNKTTKNSQDLLVRRLDCAVIETLHEERRLNKLRSFDSARGVFIEGEVLCPNAGFNEKNHIQICVRNPNCIKGFFIPRDENKEYIVP